MAELFGSPMTKKLIHMASTLYLHELDCVPQLVKETAKQLHIPAEFLEQDYWQLYLLNSFKH